MKIILFDGDCGFCNKYVKFVWDNDKSKQFRFAAIQSKKGKELLKNFNIENPSMDTFYFINDDDIYMKSDGILRVGMDLWRGVSLFFKILLLVPKYFRDLFYNIVAKNRHKIPTLKNNCELPSDEFRKSFLS